MEEAIKKLAEYVLKDLREIVPSDTGNLKNTMTYKIEGSEIQFIMEDYVNYINDGTKPHRPPISAIEGWAKRKGINPWALANHIATYGTKAQNFLNKFTDSESKYGERLSDLIYKELGIKIDLMVDRVNKK